MKPIRSASAILTTMLLVATSRAQDAGPSAVFDAAVRTLVLSAPSAQDHALIQQDQWLRAEPAALATRDVLVIHVVADVVDARAGKPIAARSLREAAGLGSAGFEVALVGKDGTIKLRQSTPITVAELASVIDAMPMRQREMQQHRARGPAPP